ncbi:MAG: hypothetical protein WBG13_06335, partial [Pseudolabrys sp.]
MGPISLHGTPALPQPWPLVGSDGPGYLKFALLQLKRRARSSQVSGVKVLVQAMATTEFWI